MTERPICLRSNVLAICALAVACAEKPTLKPPPAYALSGCAAVGVGPSLGPTCHGPAKTISVWIALAPGERIAAPAAVDAPGGARVELTGPASITVLGRAPLHIGFAPLVQSAGRTLWAEGRAAYRAGRTEDAVIALGRARDALSADASGAALSAQLLSFVHLQAGRLQAAKAALDSAKPPAEDGAARGMQAYFEALALRAAGDSSGALKALDRADLWASRLALPLRSVLVEARAMTHVEMGRIQSAIKALRGLMAQADDHCRRADLLANLGWALLASERPAAEAGTVLDDAVKAFDRCERAPPSKRVNARLNAALWRSAQGEQTATLTLPAGASPELRGWARLLAARQTPEPQRGEALDALVTDVADAGLPLLHWRALLEAGQQWRARDPAQAQIRFEQAEALVDAQAFRLPVDAGRGAFAGGRWASTAHLIELFVLSGRPIDAMHAARRARRRVLTTLPTPQAIGRLAPADQARWAAALSKYRTARAALAAGAANDWDRPASEAAAAAKARLAQSRALQDLLDDALAVLATRPINRAAPLRDPGPGEVLVTWARRPDGGWWVMTQDAAGARVHPVTGGAWTQPVRQQLARAERIVVLALGPSAAATLDLGPRPRVYGLDLPPRPRAEAGTGALIVADPTGDLPNARAEADQVAPALKAHFGAMQRLAGKVARRDALRAALQTVDHLHYAGHGDFAGVEGWGSALRLSDGPLSLSDLLVLPRVPRTVVLSACETGRADDAQAAGVGIAHALLIRGASTVVAPTTAVDDRVAASFSAALYAAWRPEEPLRAAFDAVANTEAARDYRVFVP